MQLQEFTKILAIGLALVAGVIPAAAQDMNATVIVPDAPGGARFAGCYSVAQRLYMEFCLDQRGTYTVTGGGVTCNGRLDWSARGRDVNVDLRRTACGKGVAWSADSMTCRGTSLFGKGKGAAIGEVLDRARPGEDRLLRVCAQPGW